MGLNRIFYLDWVQRRGTDEVILQDRDDETECCRCGKELHGSVAETCFYCSGDLCHACWKEFGSCGHDEIDRAAQRLAQPLKMTM